MGLEDGASGHGPAPGEVLVLHGFTRVLAQEDVRPRLMACLSPEEEARRQAFAFPRDRDMFLLAHAVMRLALGRAMGVGPLDLAFTRDAYGKPFLAGPFQAAPGFSLSHSGEAVAIAIAGASLVGVDVEAHAREVPLEAMAMVMADAEVADLAASGGVARRKAFAYWTLREAFAKAVGLGLSLPRNDVSFRLAGEGPAGDGAPVVAHLAGQFGAAGYWHLHQCDLGPDHILAVAARAPGPVAWRLMPIESVLPCAGGVRAPARPVP
ncbi:4'-phosphopantetheinyl transferase family protein [Xanthobacter oligotrophicus]|uniref:4'-phosphopantetheinyl transferase family protein n=1 Tax=Xanthobacter oligotrophicus TaxID=2607286 RepID=UPI0011F33332|nr:4'-phosphopantetheinyl transferase superfamily protein [Xanthobacter oligotrophicus]MCG5237797.1 4'-phosphopantetheinyl transferase superfamily protein [Xanthobacter oligotrophicus]